MPRQKLSEEERKARNNARSRKWRAANPLKARAASAKYRAANKPDILERDRRYRTDNRAQVTDQKLRSRYGITLSQRSELLAAQGGLCAHCGAPEADRAFHVDHCHTTGVVRGLLCRDCNVGLGLYKDNPDALRAAASYIEKHANDTR